MDQLQFDRTLTLVVAEKAIAELECSIFVDFDSNDEPFVSEIWVEPITGKGVLKLSNASAFNDAKCFLLWEALNGEAFEAVRGDVQDAMQEAA